ncbi:response regulator transcription factor [bacterium AH-315-J21]|nr:response regulator transcription factor [bacterium AH-315-J21]
MTPRKQILLVEPDAALRSEAEKVLRQAGYEVVSVDSSARAEGILTVSRFDLAVVGIQVQGENNVPFYQNWAENPERAGAPFLLLCSENESAADLPDEAIVRYPFAPEDLLAKVKIFTGSGAGPVATATNTNIGEASSLFADDEVDGALDKAFGLDQIDVHESEVLGAKDSSEISTVAKSESLVGYDAEITSVTSTQKATTDTSKIDLAFMQNKLRDMAASKKEVSDSSDLDLASASAEFESQQEAQQAPPKAPQVSPVKDTDSHDYEWFAAEMQGDGAAPSKAQPKKSPAPASPSADGSVADEGVFEWSDTPASIDSVANVFSEQMADAVARRVAERLVQQLNSDKFAQLIQQEIKAYLKERS